MNRPEHVGIGIVSWVLYDILLHLVNENFGSVILYALIAVVLGSIIPDILEPPTNWMHRDIYHSKRALKLTGKIFAVTALIGLLSYFFYIFSVSYILSNFFLGYTSHLLADSTTKTGLPD
jgi:membrane-bound metal-dependent hydrolase YbcI (DUF457 family)